MFGVLGILVAIFGIASLFLMEGFIESAPQGEQMLADMKKQRPITIVMSLVAAAVSAWLLTSGIGMAKRRAWSVPSLRWWSIAKIVLALISVGWSFYTQQGQLDAARQAQASGGSGAGGAPAAGPSAAMIGVMTTVTLAFTLLWSLALPVFSLIWLSRPKVKAETAGWR
ncbi:MAG: hypothetical protein H7Y88_11945 [Phycisphaerales bacterium]|nr:hypothetical protein [Phycisphaerales bacterium]